MVTERPDRAAINLAAGKVIVLVAGSPFAYYANRYAGFNCLDVRYLSIILDWEISIAA